LADNEPSLAIFTRRINCKTNLIFEQAEMAVGVALVLTERERADELYNSGAKRWPIFDQPHQPTYARTHLAATSL
jgi:hypothetical protein